LTVVRKCGFSFHRPLHRLFEDPQTYSKQRKRERARERERERERNIISILLHWSRLFQIIHPNSREEV
jgi:hypothetical protein